MGATAYCPLNWAITCSETWLRFTYHELGEQVENCFREESLLMRSYDVSKHELYVYAIPGSSERLLVGNVSVCGYYC